MWSIFFQKFIRPHGACPEIVNLLLWVLSSLVKIFLLLLCLPKLPTFTLILPESSHLREKNGAECHLVDLSPVRGSHLPATFFPAASIRLRRILSQVSSSEGKRCATIFLEEFSEYFLHRLVSRSLRTSFCGFSHEVPTDIWTICAVAATSHGVSRRHCFIYGFLRGEGCKTTLLCLHL